MAATPVSQPQPKRTEFFGRKFALSTFALALSISCVSSPKKEPTVVGDQGSATGQWRGKAMIRNVRTGKNGILDLDILAHEPAQMRMEVTGSFGVHVASIALNGNQVRYILTREKRFVTAPADADAFAKLVPTHIAPTALMALLFDRRLPASDWACDYAQDKETKVESATFCANKHEDVGIRWLERAPRSRRLKIISRDAEIEMVLDEAKSKVELTPESFVLTAPDGFKEEQR